MNNCSPVAIIVGAFLLVSCGGRPSSVKEEYDSGLLVTVPTDAVAVACFDRCSDALNFIPDSTDKLKKTNLSALKKAKTVISYCYTGSLLPILTADLGESSEDKGELLSNIASVCGNLKLQSAFLEKCWKNASRDAICISPSRTLTEAVKRHVESGNSILDAPFFDLAVSSIDKSRGTIFLKNSKASLLLKHIPHRITYPEKQLAKFIGSISEWTVVRPDGDGCEITTAQDGSDRYFANMISRLPFEECRIMEALPDSAGSVISIATPQAAFRENYERYLSAGIKMENYRHQLSVLKKNSGKDPLEWEKEADVSEVAAVRWDGHSVNLARSGNKLKESGISANDCRGFIPALYGKAFSIDDDSCKAVFGEWLVYGSKDDIEEFISRNVSKESVISGKRYKFVVYESGHMIYMDKKACIYGIQIGKQAS